MSIKNLTSIHDLIQGENAPVGDMENQRGPGIAFPIVHGTPGALKRGFADTLGAPFNSPLHAADQLANLAGLSLVGPDYRHQYGGLTKPSTLDMNGITPETYKDTGPDEGFYGTSG